MHSPSLLRVVASNSDTWLARPQVDFKRKLVRPPDNPDANPSELGMGCEEDTRYNYTRLIPKQVRCTLEPVLPVGTAHQPTTGLGSRRHILR